MTPDLLAPLRDAAGPVCWVGLGNADLGDDGLGVRLAEAVARAGHPHVVVAATTPEHWVETLAGGGYAHVVFLDAVDVAGEPGDVVFLGGDDLAVRYPQVSTHKLALGMLARWVGSRGTRVWLLGIKPRSLAPGAGLSEPVKRTLDLVLALINDSRDACCGAAVLPAAR